MSSTPFMCGLPVVDKLEPKNYSCILRGKNSDDIYKEVYRIANLLTTNDRIKVYPIGLRPDKPIPTSAWFAEIEIEIDYNCSNVLDTNWWTIVRGKKEAENDNDVDLSNIINALSSKTNDCSECEYNV